VPIATTEEQRSLQASIREWAKRAGTVELVRAREPSGSDHGAGEASRSGRYAGLVVVPGDAAGSAAGSPDAERWAALTELGVFGIGLPESAGGAGGSTADLAAVLAQLTESLVPGPVLPTLLAGRVLAECEPDQAHVAAIATGRISVAVALDPGSVVAEPQPDGSVLLTGRAGPVLGGGATTHVLVGAAISSPVVGAISTPAAEIRAMSTALAASDSTTATATTAGSGGRRAAWYLLAADQPGVLLRPLPPADFSRPLAELTLKAATVGPGQLLPGVDTHSVRDLAAALFAVEAAAVAAWCSRTASEYAAIRHQFGRPIGAFQAVKHLCAAMACRAETAAVLAWDAARAIDDAPDEVPLAAAAAAAFSLDAAVDVAKDCIQVLGGIGFTWEHDAHLYLRRALALRQLLGGSAAWRDRAAELAASGAPRRLTQHSAGEDDAVLAATRAAARETAARIATLPASQRRAELAAAGYAAPGWPAPYGQAATPAQSLVIDEELDRAGVARPDLVIGGWAMAAIFGHGSAEQQDRFAGPTLRGEVTWCQLFSEPEAGSDLAALRTRAEPADGGWLLTGQKVWTSLARQADWAICLARTDSAAPKHKGLTLFLVAMNSAGLDIRPLREITGREMFNQVFLDQVFVPDDCVVGPPGDGWRAARTTLASERVAMGTGSSIGDAVEQLLASAAIAGAVQDPVVRQRLGALVAEGMAVSLLDLQAVMATRSGTDLAPLAAVRKLVGVGHRQAVAETALELAGSTAAIAEDAALQEFLLTRCLSIAGGTTQILLSLVGERLLGLPREESG
jgi:hypothetical protein